MQKLISLKAHLYYMDASEGSDGLESKLVDLLAKAISRASSGTKAVKLYVSNGGGYLLFPQKIQRYWRSECKDGDPVTEWEDVSAVSFLDWLHKQAHYVKQQVYTHLKAYLCSKSEDTKGFVSPHLLGY